MDFSKDLEKKTKEELIEIIIKENKIKKEMGIAFYKTLQYMDQK